MVDWAQSANQEKFKVITRVKSFDQLCYCLWSEVSAWTINFDFLTNCWKLINIYLRSHWIWPFVGGRDGVQLVVLWHWLHVLWFTREVIIEDIFGVISGVRRVWHTIYVCVFVFCIVYRASHVWSCSIPRRSCSSAIQIFKSVILCKGSAYTLNCYPKVCAFMRRICTLLA